MVRFRHIMPNKILIETWYCNRPCKTWVWLRVRKAARLNLSRCKRPPSWKWGGNVICNKQFEKGKKPPFIARSCQVSDKSLTCHLSETWRSHFQRMNPSSWKWDVRADGVRVRALISPCLPRRNSFIPLALSACVSEALAGTRSLYLCLWMSFGEGYECSGQSLSTCILYWFSEATVIKWAHTCGLRQHMCVTCSSIG